MSVTAMVLTATMIALGIYDAIAAWKGGVNSTISRAMQYAGFKSPTIVFVLGAIFGHIFLQMDFLGATTPAEVNELVLVITIIAVSCGWYAGKTYSKNAQNRV